MQGWFTKIIIILLISTAIFSVAALTISNPTSDERNSPSDWIKEDQIKVYSNKVVLNINNPTWAKFTNTNSMDPFLDENSHAIEILPENPEDIKAGDIISYLTAQGTIIHRVIETGQDQQGIYYIVKGDNNNRADLYKVRYENIKGVVVAIIY